MNACLASPASLSCHRTRCPRRRIRPTSGRRASARTNAGSCCSPGRAVRDACAVGPSGARRRDASSRRPPVPSRATAGRSRLPPSATANPKSHRRLADTGALRARPQARPGIRRRGLHRVDSAAAHDLRAVRPDRRPRPIPRPTRWPGTRPWSRLSTSRCVPTRARAGRCSSTTRDSCSRCASACPTTRTRTTRFERFAPASRSRPELARLGIWTAAIGVAAGPGVCMPLGGPQRRHYWAVGRFMHVAGRLMEAAGSGMLCTEEVADRVRRSVSLSPERPLALKGLRWPLRSFRVRERRRRRRHRRAVRPRRRTGDARSVPRCGSKPGRGTVAVARRRGRARQDRARSSICDRRRRDGVSAAWREARARSRSPSPYAAWRPVFASLLDLPAPPDQLSQVEPAERRSATSGIRSSRRSSTP